MKTVYWLASYPKSGSTWVRWLLASLMNDDKIVSVNSLPQAYQGIGPIFNSQDRGLIDSQLGFYSADLWPDELARFRLFGFRKLMNQLDSNACLIKAHELRKCGLGDHDLFFEGAQHRVIQIVRDPRDVVLSYANFSGVSVPNAVKWLLSEDHMSPEYDKGASNAFRVPLGSWKTHFHSWHSPESFDYFLVRYEDLLKDTAILLKSIAAFMNLDFTAEEARKAAERCTFSRASSIEIKEGFSESMSRSRKFFRSGTAGGWRSELDCESAKRIADEFQDELRYLDYAAS